jgi:hypothetical protein
MFNIIYRVIVHDILEPDNGTMVTIGKGLPLYCLLYLLLPTKKNILEITRSRYEQNNILFL